MLGKYFYLEFLIPIRDYLSTLNLREALFDWFFPGIVTIFIYYLFLRGANYNREAGDFNGYIAAFLGVLVSFSLASLTLLITSSNSNIDKLKNIICRNRRIGSKRVSLYQLIIVTFTFALFVEIFAFLANVIYLLMAGVSPVFQENYWASFYAFNLFLLIHIIALNVRNTTNLYFVFLDNDDGGNTPPI